MQRISLALAGAPLCSAHGSMTFPPSYSDPEGTFAELYKKGQNKSREAGCTGKKAPGQIENAQGCVFEFYTNNTVIPGEATIQAGSPLLTMLPGLSKEDWTANHPWRAPGTAPIESPCGVDGGNPQGCPAGNPKGDGCAAGGYGHGPDGRSLAGNARPTVWEAGSQQEVAWTITANHGGGYSYRLCPLPADGRRDLLTEECFQQTPLRFATETSLLQFTNGSRTDEFEAMTTDVGTYPQGSQWRRNPIPGCRCITGPYTNGASGCIKCLGPQFEPPVPGVYGFNPDGGNGKGNVYYVLPEHNIVDKVQVPADLAPGKYVISFRYDCEQTTQVWNQCGDIEIVAKRAIAV